MEKLKIITQNPLVLKYKAFIVPAFSILICLIIIFTILIPQYSLLQQNRKSLSEINNKIDTYENKAAALNNIDPVYLRKNLTALLLVLPEDKEILTVVGQVQGLLNKNQLSLQGMTFSNGFPAENNISGFEIRIQISGDINNLDKFMKDLKEIPRITKISKLSLSGGANSGSIQSDFGITAYFQPLPGSIQNLDQPVTEITGEEKDLLSKYEQYIPVQSTTQRAAPAIPGKVDPFSK